MNPRQPTEIRLSDSAKAALGRVSSDAHARLTFGAKFLLALNGKAARTGSPVFAGVGLVEKTKRRAKGRISKASRKLNRAA